MSDALTRAAHDARIQKISQHLESAARYARRARAEKTVESYGWQWRAFESYCAEHGLESLPAEPATVAAWIASRADAQLAAETIKQGLTAVSQAHERAGYTSPRYAPAVAETWRGIRRAIGTRHVHKKAPILPEDLRAALPLLPDTLAGKRDRVVLLLGFASSLRRSELALIQCSDLDWQSWGVAIHIGRSKTDQEGRGRVVGISRGAAETCPLRALRDWLDSARITHGPVLRSVDRWGAVGGGLTGQSVAARVKHCAALLGRDVGAHGAHSLRAGFVTACRRAGVSDKKISLQTGHGSTRMLDVYDRDGADLARNAADGLL